MTVENNFSSITDTNDNKNYLLRGRWAYKTYKCQFGSQTIDLLCYLLTLLHLTSNCTMRYLRYTLADQVMWLKDIVINKGSRYLIY